MRSIIKIDNNLEGNMFEVKFGTPKPVKFKEVVKAGSDEMDDVDLEARFAAKCEVSEYDKTRYADDEAVAAAINYILSHPDIAQQMGNNGRKAVEDHYNWATQEPLLLDLYQRLEVRTKKK